MYADGGMAAASELPWTASLASQLKLHTQSQLAQRAPRDADYQASERTRHTTHSPEGSSPRESPDDGEDEDEDDEDGGASSSSSFEVDEVEVALLAEREGIPAAALRRLIRRREEREQA